MPDEGYQEIRLDAKKLVFLAMTTVVVLGAVFVLGAMVGRGVKARKDAPSADAPAAPVATVADASTPAGAPAGTASTLPPPTTANPPAEVGLSYASRLDGKNAPAETLKAPDPEKAAAAPAGKPARPLAEKPAEKVAKAEPAPADAAAKAADAANDAGRWLVKVVAYKERAQADNLAAKLTGKGYSAYVVQVSAKGLYSVQVGKFKTRREADAIRRRLEKEEQLKPSVATR
jgi:cell division septation protein DedD